MGDVIMDNKFPHLTAHEGYIYLKDVAKNVRADLKFHLPKMKIQVRKSNCDAIYVRLPVSASDFDLAKAKRICDKFQAGYFNGMVDSYEYQSTWFNKTYGSAKYIIVQKDWE